MNILRILRLGIISTSLTYSLRHFPIKTISRRLMSTATITRDSNVTPIPRILSIQSHTVHGYVGNKASILPLQCLGYNVDAINTVTLSNHPAYPNGAKGKSIDASAFEDLMQGLESNDLLGYDSILTGYMRSEDIITLVGQYITKIRQLNPKLFFVCDPVLGDNGKYYVPEELRNSYLHHLIPLASVVTPNQFEAEMLTGIQINSMETAIEACSAMHALGVPICILKGIQLPNHQYSIIISLSSAFHESFNLTYPGSSSFTRDVRDNLTVYRLDIPHISDRHFSGCGDLFSALSTGLLYQSIFGSTADSISAQVSGDKRAVLGLQVCDAIEKVALVMTQVLQLTQQLKSKELCIVQSIDLFRSLSSVSRDCAVNHHAVALESNHASACRLTGDTLGVIFDMDGTLTMPGAINFKAMYDRCGLSRADGDIVCQIAAMSDPSKREEATRIIVEEEMIGIENMVLRHDLPDLLKALQFQKIRTSISTRNCDIALMKFLEIAGIGVDRLHPLLHRDSLNGINKPDPRVSSHVLESWAIRDPASVWFVGDSLDDMLCGKYAGCKTCLVITEQNKHLVEERKDVIDISVHSLSEFGRFIGVLSL